MYETEAELDELQALLDRSLSQSTAHLQSIVVAGERTLTARQLVRVVTGMSTLAISTVTATGEPRISGIDGHFLHGRWVFGTARSAAKAKHLEARPSVSVAHMRGEELGVFTHGTVETLNPADGPDDPEWPASWNISLAITGSRRSAGAMSSTTGCDRTGWWRTRARTP